MSNQFEQISLKPGFMKHNGGLYLEISLKMNTNLNQRLIIII